MNINSLPREIQIYFRSFLGVRDLVMSELVSQSFAELANDHSLWKEKYILTGLNIDPICSKIGYKIQAIYHYIIPFNPSIIQSADYASAFNSMREVYRNKREDMLNTIPPRLVLSAHKQILTEFIKEDSDVSLTDKFDPESVRDILMAQDKPFNLGISGNALNEEQMNFILELIQKGKVRELIIAKGCLSETQLAKLPETIAIYLD